MEIAGDRAFGAAIAARGFRRGAPACRHRARTRATGAATIRDTPGNRRAPAAAIAPRGAAHVAKRIVRRTMTTETKRPAFEPPRAAVRMMRRGNASASRCPRTFGQGRAAAKPARPAAPTD
ncbi:hypothetical protein M218_11695 [Burkholderia pseudomallei MSHR338]|nr:conserved hypothetical protein [Burkholderia pseudomallei MSHR346]EQA89043.1 hypothetical protein M218_11695 [Burkholderia pseudomallei MSHR338]KEO66931.1 hypothetical protein J103_25940 [Burkholderia pseudomallei MSHR5855]